VRLGFLFQNSEKFNTIELTDAGHADQTHRAHRTCEASRW
jgi:hypothetical protein